jgi:hypothetical protein
MNYRLPRVNLGNNKDICRFHRVQRFPLNRRVDKGLYRKVQELSRLGYITLLLGGFFDLIIFFCHHIGIKQKNKPILGLINKTQKVLTLQLIYREGWFYRNDFHF